MDGHVYGLPYDTPSSSINDFMSLTVEQRSALQAVERVGASLSLVGVCLIFFTFAAFRRLRTVPNTFILFASIANVGASTACLIGYDGLNAGYDSALCQVQGFLLEMSVTPIAQPRYVPFPSPTYSHMSNIMIAVYDSI